MPDIPNRDEMEREIARKLSKLFGNLTGHLMEILEEYNWEVTAIPESVWRSVVSQEELKLLLPFLESLSAEYGLSLSESAVQIGIDWSLINQAAADWARSYSTFLVGEIDRTSRDLIATNLRNSIASFFEEGLTRGELVARLEEDEALKRLFTRDVRDRLGRVFGPYRAEMIAVTEVTRAAAEGEMITISELNRQGVQMEAQFNTSADEKVCPRCSPLDKRMADRYDANRRPYWLNTLLGVEYSLPPDPHPRCRCGVSWLLPEVQNA